MSVDEIDERSEEIPRRRSGRVPDPADIEIDTTASVGWLTGPRLRWWYRLVTVVAVAPITWSAVERGLAGWEPSWDVATTTVRIRDVFSAHPPLTGMAAAPSAGSDVAYSFPGALHLYLLALPVKVLGTTWGVLVGMAIINTAVSVVAIWLVRRRLGERWAMVGALFLAMLLWTVGNGTPIYPTPLAIGVVPLFAFFVAAWSVADGDAPALVVLAVLGNYLFLDQLVFIVIVPLVGFVALALLGARLWRLRRTRRERWRERRRPYSRWFAAGVAFTVVVWIPPLVEQFFTSGQNLGQVLHTFASGDVGIDRAGRIEPGLFGALGMVTSVTAVPRGWLPPSFGKVPFHADGGGAPFLVGLAWTLALFGLLGWAAWRASRRGDSRVATAVAIAVVGWIAFVITAANNPDWHGYLQRYFLGLWPLGSFMWFVTVVGVVTASTGWASRVRSWSSRGLGAVAGAVVIVALLAGGRSTAAPAMGPSRTDPASASVRRQVSEADLGPGPVLVTTDNRVSRRYFPSVLLGLQDAGIEFRVMGRFDAQQFGVWRSESRRHDATTRVRIVSSPTREPGERRIFAVVPPPVMSAAHFDRVDSAIHRWMSRPGRRRINREVIRDARVRAELEDFVAGVRRKAAAKGTDPLTDPDLIRILALWASSTEGPPFVIPGVTGGELRSWVRESQRRSPSGRVYGFAGPLRR